MAGTLRFLAGATFHDLDVIATAQPPLTPEQTVLDRYVFLSHARSGIAAALVTPFDWGAPARATVEVKVPVVDDSRPPIDAEMTVHVHGPGDVTEIDARQVIRAFPTRDSGTAEPDDLAHVEFDRPDLPWLFTPCGPDAWGRLVPWVTLVVTERRHLEWGSRRGTTRRARIRRDQLQPLGDAWAWAHAQVMGAKPPDDRTAPTLGQRLGESNAAHNLSRLVCPRRLGPHTAYVACVVPTFLAGVRSGLGLTPPTTLAPAWGTPKDFAGGDPSDLVELPVYFAWSFSTGDEGNFESLARKLEPAVAPPGVGRRRVDASRPWTGRTLAPDDAGAEIVVTGPVVSPQQPDTAPDEAWPTEAAQTPPPAVTDELIDRLNLADRQAHAPHDADGPATPLVTPPLYGSMHAREPRIEEAAAAAAQPPWFRELNVDLRARIVAGVATRVVQAEQEPLMAEAWNQVMGVETANRALRMAQLAARVNGSLHRRHLSRLSDAALVSVTERVHPKVPDGPQRTVWASLAESSLPTSVTLGAFRRLARVRGPVVRAAARNAAAPAAAISRLVVQPDRLTTDWVQTYAAPDGVAGLAAAARAMVTDEIAERVAPGVGRDALLGSWDEEFARPPAPDLLTRRALEAAPEAGPVDMTPPFAARTMDRLLRTAPAPRAVVADRQAAMVGVVHATLIVSILKLAPDVDRYDVAVPDVRRLRLQALDSGQEGERLAVSTDRLRRYCAQVLDAASAHQLDSLRRSAEGSGERLHEVGRSAGRLEAPVFVEGLAALADRTVVGEVSVEGPRRRVDTPALSLVAKLDPALTVPARVRARFTSGSGRLPRWLRPDWFDDARIEPVMAHPRFAYPMYEPLHRYDRDWMVPGLGKIPRPDMATLLVTNNSFIEAYLVGLNHEMARELLWREYPTDQRGTYFSSFWTRQPELSADLHEAAWRTGGVGAHLKGADAQLVFLVRGELVRRYPGVVAHAVRQAGSDAGIPLFEAAGPVRTLFHAHLAPNVLLVGFSLTPAQVTAAGPAWWFTLSENPSEPRFGLDPSRPGGVSRDNLIWADFGVTRAGQFLDATRHTGLHFGDAAWGASSAQVASLLFQLPARAAFRATTMVDGAMLHG